MKLKYEAFVELNRHLIEFVTIQRKIQKSFKKSLTGFFLEIFKNIFECSFCVYWAQKAFNGSL